VVSIFDDDFVGYALRMYRSFRFFDRETKMYAGSMGISDDNKKKLRSLGIEILESKSGIVPKNLCICDLMMHDYLRQVEWDKVMWIDADTIVLRPISHLFELEFDFVGHGGNVDIGFYEQDRMSAAHLLRNTWISRYEKEGRLVEKCRWGDFFAMGLWVAGKKVVEEMWSLFLSNTDAAFEGDICSRMFSEKGYKTLQMDGYEWSIGTLQKDELRFESGEVVFERLGRKCKPYQFGYSRTDRGRPRCDAVEKFYKHMAISHL
jgi:hypothetical protein